MTQSDDSIHTLKEFTKLLQLHDIHCFVINSEPWVDIDDFYNFLVSNIQPLDKPLRKSNIKAELYRIINETRTINGKFCCSIKALLKFVFHHSSDFNVCNEIVDSILSLLSSAKETAQKEPSLTDDIQNDPFSLYRTDGKDFLLGLYQDITKTDFSVSSNSSNIHHAEETKLHYIYHPYKGFFSEEQWLRICEFEKHFQLTIGEEPNRAEQTYTSNLLKQKRTFFNACVLSRNLGKYWQSLNRACCSSIKNRKAVATAIDGVVVETDIIHLPEYLENCLYAALEEINHTEIQLCVRTILCVGCCELCRHSKGVHVFCELEGEQTPLTLLSDISFIVQTSLKDHVHVPEIVWLEHGTISRANSGETPRHLLRDLYVTKKIDNKIIYVYKCTSDADILDETLDGKHCKICFKAYEKNIDNPLRVKGYDILQEWQLNVPLPFRLLLEHGVVNADSTRKSDNQTSFIVSKIRRLQTIYDIILNTYNKKHVGITQEINTSILTINHHNVACVLGITQDCGITRAIHAAEKWLKNLAEPEKCYFECFIRKHPLLYKSVTSVASDLHLVSLRECHLILFLDNLVRLQKRADPDRGSSHTTQICTLPITVKGLPKDNEVTLDWHLEECEGDPKCGCKDRIVLNKNDMERCIFNQSEEETAMQTLLTQHIFWDLCTIIKASSTLQDLLNDAAERSTIAITGNDISSMENSFQDLSITEDPVYSATKGVDQSCSDEDHAELDDLEKYFDDSHELSDIFAQGVAQLSTIKEVSSPPQRVSLFSTNTTEDDIDEQEAEELLNECALILKSIPLTNTSSSSQASRPCNIISHTSTIQPEEDWTVHVDGSLSRQSSISTISCLNLSEDHEISTEDSKTCDPDHSLSEVTENSTLAKEGNEPSKSIKPQPFKKYQPPCLLCKHPPPAIGKDDDKWKLKEILDDFLVKSGQIVQEQSEKDRILFAPDQKIASNLFILMEENMKYRKFLPEFPVLHLLKSKITNLFSAYKTCGLFHLLKFLQDDEDETEWTKLVTITHIETAIRNIRRLSLTLHLAMFIRFVECLELPTAHSLIENMAVMSSDDLEGKWGGKYREFIDVACGSNGTFLLHVELMRHCGEIVGLSIAERIGGTHGYNLLLSIVKASLPFAFVNGAASYGKFSIHLLCEHFSAGYFHQQLKASLFATPHHGSDTNFSLDSQREMDHRDALKAFRPSAALEAIVPRMSVIDILLSAEESVSKSNTQKCTVKQEDELYKHEQFLGKYVTERDLQHVIPTIRMILRRGALPTHEDQVPQNIYEFKYTPLSECVLDRKTLQIGNYLIKRYLCQQSLFSLTEHDMPSLDNIDASKVLKQRVKAGKSVTITRAKFKPQKTDVTAKQEKRKKMLLKLDKFNKHATSEMNTFQAVVTPECTKGNVSKSKGVRTALVSLLTEFNTDENNEISSNGDRQKKDASLILLEEKNVPVHISQRTATILVEFAGVKFKAFGRSGLQYLRYIENGVLRWLLKEFPFASHVVICEEKYYFTPDDLKTMTRANRTKEKKNDIYHLKDDNEIIGTENISKPAVTKTMKGKKMISNFMAGHVQELRIMKDIVLDIDSEYYLSPCTCDTPENHNEIPCKQFAIPIRSHFASDKGYVCSEKLDMKQKKGEAELAQADWLCYVASGLKEGENVVSYVSSGDIDSIPIHILAISLYLPRKNDGNFKNHVYVVIKKPGSAGKLDIYNITGIVRAIEMRYNEDKIAVILSFSLSLGGNDFIPKFYGISHEKWLKGIFENETFRRNLFKIRSGPDSGHLSVAIDPGIYISLLKNFYCPSKHDAERLSLEEVRQLSIKLPGKDVKSPKLWMPPVTALHNICKLINSCLQYLLTAGVSEAELPNFVGGGGLKKVGDVVEYELGPDVHYDNIEDLLRIPEEDLKEALTRARMRQQRKRELNETPGKERQPRKCKLITSTPRKRRDV